MVSAKDKIKQKLEAKKKAKEEVKEEVKEESEQPSEESATNSEENQETPQNQESQIKMTPEQRKEIEKVDQQILLLGNNRGYEKYQNQIVSQQDLALKERLATAMEQMVESINNLGKMLEESLNTDTSTEDEDDEDDVEAEDESDETSPAE